MTETTKGPAPVNIKIRKKKPDAEQIGDLIYTKPPPWARKFVKGKHVRAILVGSSESGKTYGLTEIFRERIDGTFDMVMVFTNSSIDQYADFIPGNLIFQGRHLVPEKNQETLSIQEILYNVKTWQENLRAMRKPYIDVLAIFDDQDGGARYKQFLSNMFRFWRHPPFNMSILYLAQSLSDISPTWIRQCAFIMNWKTNDQAGRMILAEKVFSRAHSDLYAKFIKDNNVEITQEAFWLAMQDTYNQDYGCLVSDQAENKVFYFRAK